MERTALQRAFKSIRLRKDAVTLAEDVIHRLQRANDIDEDYARDRLRRLSAKRLDLEAERDALALTTAVTSAPSEEEVKDLADAVRDLNRRNVTAENVRGFIREIFNLISIAADN